MPPVSVQRGDRLSPSHTLVESHRHERTLWAAEAGAWMNMYRGSAQIALEEESRQTGNRGGSMMSPPVTKKTR